MKRIQVILQSPIQDAKLTLPRSFVNQYGKDLSNPVTLVLPNGAEWKVNWTKGDCDTWFHEGWEKFAKHYSLSHGRFLVFRYEGRSQFHVLIFSKSALEIEYPTSKSSTNDGEGTNISHEYAEKNYDTPPQRKNNTEGARREVPVNAKNWSRSKRRNNRALEGIEGSTALDRSKKFKSDYPFFSRKICQSYLQQDLLNVAASFSKEYLNRLEGSASIVVSEQMDKEWPVRVKYTEISNRTTIVKGWKSIAQEYNLQVGDICAFEMIPPHNTDFAFKMTIFSSHSLSPRFFSYFYLIHKC
ncbi:hypothetical protein VNO78_09839 [Psophocarpus tetragonolobus]|uniref:TF-B3 domain-containing protein n=1 Tax=Psophocarpus tetragonolobus TaxID=3891 RepID=A0AAN9SWU5_PSOTE